MADTYNGQLDAFSLYHQAQESSNSASSAALGPALPALGHAISGSTGTAISNVLVFPLDLIITRLQVQRQLRKKSSVRHDEEYRSIYDAMQKIYSREGGLSGFYTGVAQDTAASVADSFLFFLSYNFLRQRRLQSRGGHGSLPVLDELSIGFLAGASAKLLTTPISNIVTRKQTSAMISARSRNESQSSSLSVKDIAHQILDEKGLRGFWSGYSASLVLTINPTLTFFFHQLLRRSLLPRSKRDKPTASATFLLAAISKAIASTITYPFSLVKARAQASAANFNDDTEIKEEIEKASNGKVSGSKVSRIAARKTVFSTILQIARADGVGALYEGLSGQVLKGFFSHGITMLVKEAVHKCIIQLYFLVLKALKRYPSPQELARSAREQTQTAASITGDRALNVAVTVKEGAKSMAGKGQEVMQDGQVKAQAMYKSGREEASNLYDQGIQQARDAYDKASTRADALLKEGKKSALNTQDRINTTTEKARELSNRGQDQASDLYQKSKEGASTMQKTADSFMANIKDIYQRSADEATHQFQKSKQEISSIHNSSDSTTDTVAEYVGRRTEEVGRSIRPAPSNKEGDT